MAHVDRVKLSLSRSLSAAEHEETETSFQRMKIWDYLEKEERLFVWKWGIALGYSVGMLQKNPHRHTDRLFQSDLHSFTLANLARLLVRL